MTTTLSIPNATALNILIRRTLLTLNDANLSGNYSILRRLAAPSFQQENSSAKIARAFTNMRDRKIDMAPVVNFNPRLVRKPTLTKSGALSLQGFMPTRPEQINFAMEFEKNEKRWTLSGIAVKFSTPKTAAATKGKATKKANKKSN